MGVFQAESIGVFGNGAMLGGIDVYHQAGALRLRGRIFLCHDLQHSDKRNGV